MSVEQYGARLLREVQEESLDEVSDGIFPLTPRTHGLVETITRSTTDQVTFTAT